MTRGKDGHLSNTMIYKNGDGIESLGWGESDDEVHRSSRERGSILSRGDRQQGNGSAIRLIFCRLTNSAAINIVKYKPSHPGPEEMTTNEVIGLIATWVSRCGKIVEQLDKIMVEGIIFGDIDTASTEYKSTLNRPMSTKRGTGSR